MGFIEQILQRFNFNKRFCLWSLFVIIIFLFFGFLKVIPAALCDFNVWYPLDDAYIYHAFAQNLAKGHFLTYSIGEPYTNGCSSFLYYLVYSMIIFFSKLLFSGDLFFKATQIVVMVINSIFYIVAVFYSKKIFEEFIPKEKQTLIFGLLISIFTVNAVYFSSFSGLEVALTTLLVILITYYVITQNYRWLFIFMVLSNINRPENIVMNVFLFGYLYYEIFSKRIKLDKVNTILFVIAQLSLFIIPLINYIFVGTIYISSTARVGTPFSGRFLFLGTLLTGPNIILDFLFLPFCIQGKVWGVLKGLKESLSLILISIFTILFFWSYYKTYHQLLEYTRIFTILFFWSYYKRYFKTNHIRIIFIILAYLCLPYLLTRSGEWYRYLVPVFPLLLILVYTLVFQFSIKIVRWTAILIVIVNLLLCPVWMLYSLESMNMINQMMLPMANYLEKNIPLDARVGIDQAGLTAVKNHGVTIDVYGLGTQRYAKIFYKFKKVYEQIKNDKLNYFVTWPSETKQYYLDSAHYTDAYKDNAKIEKVYSTKYEKEYIFDQFPREWVLYKVIYPETSKNK